MSCCLIVTPEYSLPNAMRTKAGTYVICNCASTSRAAPSYSGTTALVQVLVPRDSPLQGSMVYVPAATKLPCCETFGQLRAGRCASKQWAHKPGPAAYFCFAMI